MCTCSACWIMFDVVWSPPAYTITNSQRGTSCRYASRTYFEHNQNQSASFNILHQHQPFRHHRQIIGCSSPSSSTLYILTIHASATHTIHNPPHLNHQHHNNLVYRYRMYLYLIQYDHLLVLYHNN